MCCKIKIGVLPTHVDMIGINSRKIIDSLFCFDLTIDYVQYNLFSIFPTDYDLINLIHPRDLNELTAFKRQYILPITQGQSVNASTEMSIVAIDKLDKLHKMLDRFIDRVGPEILQKELKPKHDIHVYLCLCDRQRDDYKVSLLLSAFILYAPQYYITNTKYFFQKYIKTIHATNENGGNNNLFQIYNSLIRICAHPAAVLDALHVDVDYTESIKMLFIVSMIEECKLINGKIIIFSSSLNNLDVIENVLQNTGLTKDLCYYRIDGKTNDKAREEACKQCNDKNNKTAR